MSCSAESPDQQSWLDLPIEVFHGLPLTGSRNLHLLNNGSMVCLAKGGWGNDQRYSCHSMDEQCLELFTVDGGERLRGVARFQDEVEAVFELKEQAGEFLRKIRKHLPCHQEADYDSQLMVSLQPRFSSTPEELKEHLVKRYPALKDMALDSGPGGAGNALTNWYQRHIGDTIRLTQWYEFLKSRRHSTAADIVIAEVLRGGESYVRVQVLNGRLLLSRNGDTVAQIPLDVLVQTTDGRRLILNNQTTLAGQAVEQIVLAFPTSGWLEALSADLKCESVGKSAVSEVVRLSGRLTPERHVEADADALLFDDSIEFRDVQTGSTLCRFSFSRNSLRVAGTSREFILFDEEFGPVTVSDPSESFRESLNKHQRLRVAARRSLENGPYALRGENGAVVLEPAGDQLSLKGVDLEQTISVGDLRKLTGGGTGIGVRLEMATAEEEFVFEGEPDMVQACHTDLQARLLETKQEASVEKLSRQVLGMEGDYFLYTVFAPFYHLEKLFCDQGLRGEEPESLTVAMERLALVAQGLGDLVRHLDMIVLYLPNWVAGSDLKLLKPLQNYDALKLCKSQERGLRRVLSQCMSLNADIGRLHSMVTARTGLRAAKIDHGPLAISLVGASIFSPICLLAGAQHAYNAESRGKQQAQLHQETIAQVLNQATQSWDYLLKEKVPLFSYHLVEDIFGLRIEFAGKLGKLPQADLLRPLLARRWARLHCMFCYPEDAAMNYPRRQVVDTIKKAREAVSYQAFHPL